MKIAIGSDHGGYGLKENLKKFLEAEGYQTKDCGTDSSEFVDYSDFAVKVCESVLSGSDLGILVCGTGIGMSITANRFPGIRAALCMSKNYAKLAKEHNNANVLALGGRFLKESDAKEIVKTFIETEFTNKDRYVRRIKKAEEIGNIFSDR